MENEFFFFMFHVLLTQRHPNPAASAQFAILRYLPASPRLATPRQLQPPRPLPDQPPEALLARQTNNLQFVRFNFCVFWKNFSILLWLLIKRVLWTWRKVNAWSFQSLGPAEVSLQQLRRPQTWLETDTCYAHQAVRCICICIRN